MTLSCLDAAVDSPDRTAIISGGVGVSYASLAALVREAMARLPATGPVPLIAHPDLASIVTLHACLAARRSVVLLHPRGTAQERERALTGLGPLDEGTLAVAFTSGSTGGPKGVELGRDAVAASALASAANLGWKDDDRWLLSLPFAHVGGLSVLTRCLLARRTVVLGALPDAIELARVTLLSLVPAQLAQLLRRSPRWDPPEHVRAMLVGGAAAPSALLNEAADRRWPVLTTYGLTETCSQVATQRLGSINRGEQGCGEALPGAEVRVVDGAIEVRGPMLFTRYVPGAARSSGDWFTTGDLGHLDERGRLHVVGRRDEVIITGGEKVLPQEVEAALESCPGIAQACVFGVPDATWGQVVSAAIISRRGEPLDIAALLEARLAPYKRPRRVAFVSTLPVTGAGKLDRRAAAAQCESALRPV